MDFHHRAPESREQRTSLQFSLFLTSNSKSRNILSTFYRVGNGVELARNLSGGLLLIDLYSYMKEGIFSLKIQNLSGGTFPHSLRIGYVRPW
jgi:hypothetical protein